MPPLSNAQRELAWAEYMRELSLIREPIGATKVELRLILDQVDSYLDTNRAAPQADRGLARAALSSPVRNLLSNTAFDAMIQKVAKARLENL